VFPYFLSKDLVSPVYDPSQTAMKKVCWYKVNVVTLGMGKAFQTTLFLYTMGKLFLEAL
jgi:hypothetical protein